MHTIRILLGSLLAVLTVWSCEGPEGRSSGSSARQVALFQPPVDSFGSYWYQGVAELSSYGLRQNRYRDHHPGEVVLVFVTENFLTEKQVKDEQNTDPNSTTVLKTNMMRRFPTGLYDYSIMTSVFTPVQVDQFPHSLKVTHSSQDWCGQTFMQVNKERARYRVQLFSYFESEGDKDFPSPAHPMEDELFNRVRLNPDGLPTGSLQMYPSLTFCRLNHVPFKPQRVEAERQAYRGDDFSGKQLMEYRVVFGEINRSLSIVYQAAFPHRIEGWTETYPSVSDGLERTTLARRKKTIQAPYWELNDRADMPLRDSLRVRGM